ncbi:MAG: hypothetical protein QOI77_2128 [Blastocatellia bacterium]|nr:hypothetical protein [Blastocatellia bacterium]
MKHEGAIKRQHQRIPLALPFRVRCKESVEYEWTEMSRLIDITQAGAGFTLTRPAEPGRLLHLTLPLPIRLRCFDHAEPQYCVWTVVRHIAVIQGAQGQVASLFRAGVAFVGKRPPQTYEQDPTTRYDLLPFDRGQSEMWRLKERANNNQRRETRLIIPLDVLIEAFDEKGNISMEENTVTENLTTRGTSVFTTWDIEIGRILRVTSVRDAFSVLAVVRGREVGSDGVNRLGLEFLNERWPLHRVEPSTV